MFFKNRFLKKYREKLRKIKNKHTLILQHERNKFVSILNHDIKTPILAQNQSLELLLKEVFGEVPKRQKEILKEIYNSNNFLFEVVTNSIFLAKYESENPKLNMEKLDIVEQIKDCCEMVKNFASEKQQNIIIKSSTDKKIKLNGDRKLIQKIIFNILSSSVSYGFENSDIEVLIKENKDSVSFYTKKRCTKPCISFCGQLFSSFSRAESFMAVVSTSIAFSSSSTGGRLGAIRKWESLGSLR